MTETVYDIGDLVHCSAVFTVGGVNTDPTGLSFKFKKPNGTVTTYIYGIDTELVRDSAGHYHVDISIDESGTWYYRFAGTGAATDAEEQLFHVEKSEILDETPAEPATPPMYNVPAGDDIGDVPVWDGSGYVPRAGIMRMPVGTIIEAATNPDAAKWLPMDSSWVSRTTWPALSVLIPNSQFEAPWDVLAAPELVYWSFLVWNGSYYMAGIYNSCNYVYTSVDLVTWVKRTLPVTAAWKCVVWTGTSWVLVGSTTDQALVSANGIDWIQATLPASAAWNAVGYGNGRLIAIVNGTASAISTDDGATWTSGGIMPSSTGWGSICYSDTLSLFLAVPTSASTTTCAISPDGTSWTPHDLLTQSRVQAVWNGSIFGIISFNAFEYSEDGSTWIQLVPPTGLYSASLPYCKGLVAIGSRLVAVYSGAVFVSDDNGYNWKCCAFMRSQDISQRAVAWNGQSLACMGSSSYQVVMRSPYSASQMYLKESGRFTWLHKYIRAAA